MRSFIKFSFDGTAYHGWQIQENAHSVQAELEKALSILLHANVSTIGCGRTDTGVHARKFYAHFDAELDSSKYKDLVHSLNAILPLDIAIDSIIAVHADAHARFDAVSRTYEYSIHSYKHPFLRRYSWFNPNQFDIDAMNSISQILLEHKDFSCFSKSGGQTTNKDCKITEALWNQSGDQLIFRITANRFLRNMVRAIVGTLLESGKGKLTKKEFQHILKSGDRSQAGFSVPALGLSLVDVQYPYEV